MCSAPALVLPAPSPHPWARSALHFLSSGVEAQTQPGGGPPLQRDGSWMLFRHETLQVPPVPVIVNFRDKLVVGD